MKRVYNDNILKLKKSIIERVKLFQTKEASLKIKIIAQKAQNLTKRNSKICKIQFYSQTCHF